MQQLISQYKQNGYEIYYNGSGDPQMYRWGIKHLSAAVNDKMARKLTLNGDVLEITGDRAALYEEGDIKPLKKEEKIKLIPLVYLNE